MANYIDGFVLAVPRDQLDTYRKVVESVAKIWREYGALNYSEYVSDDSKLEGTRPFSDVVNKKDDEVIIFGWVTFESRKARDIANKKVAADSRMTGLISPLTDTSLPIFDAKRMVYGGFQLLV